MFGALFKKNWQKRLTTAEPDQLDSGIAEIVADALREDDRVGTVRVTSATSLVASVQGGEQQLFCYNLLPRLKNAEPDQRIDIVRQFIRMMESADPALRDLVPVLKTTAWVDEARTMIAKQSPPHMVDANMLVTVPFAGDLHVALAFDRPDSMAFATAGTLQELGVALDDALLIKAKETLRERLPPVEVQKGPASCMVTCGGNFEASVLLFDEIIDQLAPLFDGDLIALVPARDVLMLTGARTEGGLAEIVGVAERIHATGGNYLLSTQPLVRTATGWAPYVPGAAG